MAERRSHGRSVQKQLFDAIDEGDLERVKILLQRGADVNEKLGWSPLHSATIAGNLDIVKFLVRNGAQMDVKDDWDNKTPLDYAYINCHDNIANYLKGVLTAKAALELSRRQAEESASKNRM